MQYLGQILDLLSWEIFDLAVNHLTSSGLVVCLVTSPLGLVSILGLLDLVSTILSDLASVINPSVLVSILNPLDLVSPVSLPDLLSTPSLSNLVPCLVVNSLDLLVRNHQRSAVIFAMSLSAQISNSRHTPKSIISKDQELQLRMLLLPEMYSTRSVNVVSASHVFMNFPIMQQLVHKCVEIAMNWF